MNINEFWREGKEDDTVVLCSLSGFRPVTQERDPPFAVPLQTDVEMASTMRAWAACLYSVLPFTLTVPSLPGFLPETRIACSYEQCYCQSPGMWPLEASGIYQWCPFATFFCEAVKFSLSWRFFLIKCCLIQSCMLAILKLGALGLDFFNVGFSALLNHASCQ